MNLISRQSALALAAVLLIATPVAAQSGGPGGGYGMIGGTCPSMGMMGPGGMGPGGMGPGGMGMGQGGGPGMGRRGMGMGAMIDARLAYLKAQLGITEAQAKVWAAYEDTVKNRAAGRLGNHDAMMDAKANGTAIDRLDLRIAAMETMIDLLKSTREATVALYDSLSAEQKVVADQLIGNDCGAM
ncbi:Spy/CpxP family protein refolding chaperone [Zavarzinia sp.]|uniref:Spy/CpxP family protein refolding chaperone n=1 Tax=Zavarzinia sp. TaxID=2027920 RepID=UPI003BB5E3A5|nr:Spy/CpxP family protein refolding chaperone [Zavarzinia sp.]